MNKHSAALFRGDDSLVDEPDCVLAQGSITMPELTHYGYDGGSTSYSAANTKYQVEAIKRAKKFFGLQSVRHKKIVQGADIHLIMPSIDRSIVIENI